MSSITIRNLNQGLKARLRMRAARHRRSIEDEAREILRAALNRRRSEPANRSHLEWNHHAAKMRGLNAGPQVLA